MLYGIAVRYMHRPQEKVLKTIFLFPESKKAAVQTSFSKQKHSA